MKTINKNINEKKIKIKKENNNENNKLKY